MFLALTWRDHRLRLPGGELSILHLASVKLLIKYKGCWDADYRILDVNWIKDIWRPDCIFKNAKDIDFQVIIWNIYKEDVLIVSCKTICPDFGVMGARAVSWRLMIIISAPNCAQPLSLALQGQDAALYGKIDSQAVLWDGLYGLSP